MTLWQTIELATDAPASIWRERLGASFNPISTAFLTARRDPAQFVPCRKCGCAHEITIHAPNDIAAVCTCDPWNCNDISLTAADLEIFELDWHKLARALCRAL